MNADILKPFLAEAAAAFEGQSVGVTLELSTGSNGLGIGEYQTHVTVGSDYFWGVTLDDALAKAKAEFTPEKYARKVAAQQLRDQADRIANGTDPIPAAIEAPATV